MHPSLLHLRGCRSRSRFLRSPSPLSDNSSNKTPDVIKAYAGRLGRAWEVWRASQSPVFLSELLSCKKNLYSIALFKSMENNSFFTKQKHCQGRSGYGGP